MRSTYLRLDRGAEDLRAGGALARFSKADLVSELDSLPQWSAGHLWGGKGSAEGIEPFSRLARYESRKL